MATIKRRVGGTNPTTVKRREYFTAFSPRSIAGCSLWLDAADASTITLNGTNVASWQDKSGNGYSVGQSTPANQPSYSTNRLNGLAGIGLTSSTYLIQSGSNISNFASSSATTVFIVAKNDSSLPTNGWSILNTMWFNGTTRYHLSFSIGTTQGVGLYANGGLIGQTTIVPLGSSAIVGFTLAATGNSINVNGTLTNYSGITPSSAANSTWFIFGDNRGGFETDMNVYEFVGFSANLTTIQRQQVESYLAQKWGLTGSLPAGHSQFTQPAGKPNTVTNPTPGLFPVLKPIPFSPLSVTPLLWLDASQSSSFTFASANNISVWADRSGYGNNATQPTAGIQPTYTTNTVNLSGTQWFAVNLDFVAGHDFSAFIVLNNTNYTNIYGAITGGNGSSSLHNGFSSSGAYRVNYWGNDYYPGITAAYRAGNKNLINIDWVNTGGVGKSVRANATLEGSVGQTGTVSAMSGGGTIGNVVSQGILSGTIFEIIFILDTKITTINRNKLEGYLAWKWGIQSYLPPGHPYLSAPP